RRFVGGGAGGGRAGEHPPPVVGGERAEATDEAPARVVRDVPGRGDLLPGAPHKRPWARRRRVGHGPTVGLHGCPPSLAPAAPAVMTVRHPVPWRRPRYVVSAEWKRRC